jgi:glycosyltransferase involved in cell wall biosynthesis
VRHPVRRDDGRPPKLIHVASLNRVKDQPTLLRALQVLQRLGLHFEMDIVGEDTLKGEMQRMTSQLGLSESVKFHGFLPQRQLRPLIEAADLMIVSSRHETGPIALLEAAIAGVPTVGTEVGHITEWAPGAAASAPVGDSGRLADAIARMMNDEDLRLRVAFEAQNRAIREDADYTLARFQRIYSDLL